MHVYKYTTVPGGPQPNLRGWDQLVTLTDGIWVEFSEARSNEFDKLIVAGCNLLGDIVS